MLILNGGTFLADDRSTKPRPIHSETRITKTPLVTELNRYKEIFSSEEYSELSLEDLVIPPTESKARACVTASHIARSRVQGCP